MLVFFYLNILLYQLKVEETTTYIFKEYENNLYINRQAYRESSNYNKDSSLFTITLNPNKYIVNKPPYYTTIANVTKSSNQLDDKILVKGRDTLIDDLIINIYEDSLLWICGRVSSLPFPSNKIKHPPAYKLVMNGETILQKQTPIFSFFLNIPIKKGIYKIEIIGNSKMSYWCSCPSIGNGFVLSHGLSSWYTPISSKDLTNIKSVSDNLTNISSVSDNLTNISSVSDNLTNISSVSDNLTNISSVSDNLTNISSVSDNLTNIPIKFLSQPKVELDTNIFTPSYLVSLFSALIFIYK